MHKETSEDAPAACDANMDKRRNEGAKMPCSTLPKKRKLSNDSSNHSCPQLPQLAQNQQIRKASTGSAEDGLGGGGSHASEDTTTMALKAFAEGSSVASKMSSLSGHRQPPKKRKASIDYSFDESSFRKRFASMDSNSDITGRRKASIGSFDDAALGLVPLGSAGNGTLEVPSVAKHTPLDNILSVPGKQSANNALDHLEALGDEAASLASKRRDERLKPEEGRDDNSMTSSNHRTFLEAFMMTGGATNRRGRLESWGGMSDLSMTGMGPDPSSSLMEGAAAALAASALHQTGLIEDVTAAANSCSASVNSSVSGEAGANAIPSKIALTSHRKYSIASQSDSSSLAFPPNVDGDIQAYVAAAMASVGNQLAELAGVVETVANSANSITSDILKNEESDLSSTNSTLPDPLLTENGRPRSWSTSSRALSVDYEAVAAAVDAAEAATGTLDLSSFASVPSIPQAKPESRTKTRKPWKLPLTKNRKQQHDKSTPASQSKPGLGPLHLPPLPSVTSSSGGRDMEEIRAKARAAAGYVPPTLNGMETPEVSRQPLKKRTRRADSIESGNLMFTTPSKTKPDHTPSSNMSKPKVRTPASEGSKAASQRWDEMFECLLDFIEERRESENKGLSEKEKQSWEWDGNVPTSYKAKDGKGLGRWINNQRSARNKGALKRERETKLLSTGLKWSILTTNSWEDMMEELRIYVQERTKDGQEWDGNVPTNYTIKTSNGDDGDEEKNLGRWINRQRTQYQTGKLREDRRLELERIGLRWSVLSTSSWDSNYESLIAYIKEKQAADPNGWDGNVPASYKTRDDPPKALGRWINRQRTTHMKNKLKKEHVDKLNQVGLKWSVHERRNNSGVPSPATPLALKREVKAENGLNG